MKKNSNKYSNLKKISLNEAKKYFVDTLKDLTNFFDSIDVKYSIMYGTLLGAVRHKGFIPWDDDIDIALKRDQYDKLINYIRTNGYKSDKYFFNGFAINEKDSDLLKFFNKEIVTYDNLNDKNIYVWIDIFVFDGVPNNRFQRFFYYTNLKILKFIYLIKFVDISCPNYFGNNKKKIFIYKIFSFLFRPINYDKLKKFFIGNYSKKFDVNKCDMITNNTRGLLDKAMFPSKIMDELKPMQFENEYFYGVKDYDTVLKKFYGDYMKLPPLDKRVNHQVDFYIDKDYKKNK